MKFYLNLLEKMLRNTSGESPSNRAIIFTQTQALAQPEENMGEQAQDLLCSPTFVQSTIHAPTLAATEAFASKSKKQNLLRTLIMTT
jgi:hypothetical protein